MCYLDAINLEETNALSTSLDELPDICGGFFFDNFNTRDISGLDINDLYATAQVLEIALEKSRVLTLELRRSTGTCCPFCRITVTARS